MALSPGSHVGPYEITALLGEGGMGKVWRAHHTALKRDDALKVLPDAFASDPERLRRFQREAQVLASLNHPNIAHVYGFEQSDGVKALVMELVEGPTLADRIAQGAIPVDEALPISEQIAEALEAAHEQGIVHRDLKPANIKVRPDGTVKVLDFGLAKALETAGSVIDVSQSPTITSPAKTRMGVILGTAAYMSPEQARGKPVDRRADIWAFGCVLYEMLTGRRLFEGDTASDTIASVLTKEPDWNRTPAQTRRLIQSCLERDPRRRLRDIGDRWRLLEPALTVPPSRTTAKWVAASLAGVVVALALWAWSLAGRSVEPASDQPIRLAFDLGPDASVAADLPVAILSPDGTRIVFVTTDAQGVNRLSMRRLEQSEVTPLAGTEGAYAPFFSPDGQWVGFFAGGKLKKTSLEGGQPVTLCDAPAGRGASWGENGMIVAALDIRVGLSLVSEDGGAVSPVTALGPAELSHRWPQMLPGGNAVLFTVGSVPSNYEAAAIAVASLENNPEKAKKVILARAGLSPRYLPTGHVVYVTKGTLYAVRFDLDRLETLGTATPVLDELSADINFGSAQLDFSRSGMVLYRSARTTGLRVVQWLSGNGQTEALWAEPAFYQMPQVSPDGSRLASVLTDGPNADIWVYEWQRGSRTRLTGGSGVNTFPLWTPDGQYVVFQSDGRLVWTRADGAERPQRLSDSEKQQFPTSFSPDGKRLLLYEHSSDGGTLIQTMSIENRSGQLRAGPAELFRRTPSTNPTPTFSHDGRWVAYASAESGVYEVYVRAFPDDGRQWAISTEGGSFPVWSRTTNELFYRTEDQLLMVTSYTVVGNSFVAGKPRVWSDRRLSNTGLTLNFDVAPDGKRFAALMPLESSVPREPQRHVMLVLNFFDELRRLAPTN